jgi:hypothetical protein
MSSKASQKAANKRKPKEIQRPEFLDSPAKEVEVTAGDIRKAKEFVFRELDTLISAYKKFITTNGDAEAKSSNREEYNNKKKLFKSDMNKLISLSMTMKKRRRNGGNRTNKGFLIPKYFRPELVAFIKEEADSFGNYCYFEGTKPIETDQKIVSKLTLLMKENITATSLLTALFHIYIKRNSNRMLVNDQKQFIKFTPAMKKHFSGFKNAMMSLMKTKRDNVQSDDINFDKFPTVRLQTLFSVLIDKDRTDVERLKDSKTIKELEDEQDFVSKTNYYLKMTAMAKSSKDKPDEQNSRSAESSQQESVSEKRKEKRVKNLK